MSSIKKPSFRNTVKIEVHAPVDTKTCSYIYFWMQPREFEESNISPNASPITIIRKLLLRSVLS